jgi:hydrogenase expression/formation protein HypD
VLGAVRQLEAGEARVDIAYARAVQPGGNPRARAVIEEVFEVCDRSWRGIGRLPKSGLRIRHELRTFDAEHRFDVSSTRAEESPACISGRILRGLAKPPDCPAFGRSCTPETPLGATMVSSEGACAAYHRYRQVPGEGAGA